MFGAWWKDYLLGVVKGYTSGIVGYGYGMGMVQGYISDTLEGYVLGVVEGYALIHFEDG